MSSEPLFALVLPFHSMQHVIVEPMSQSSSLRSKVLRDIVFLILKLGFEDLYLAAEGLIFRLRISKPLDDFFLEESE